MTADQKFRMALKERIEKAQSAQSLSAYRIVENIYERLHVDPLKDFYNWYAERNAVTRIEVLNELERRCGLEVQDYPEKIKEK